MSARIEITNEIKKKNLVIKAIQSCRRWVKEHPRFIIKWLRKRPWVLALLLVVMITLPAFIRVETLIDCINDWSSESTARGNILREANNKKADALDAVMRAAISQPPDRDLLVLKLNEYVARSDEYNAALRDNPVPETPELRCDLI
jgi:hypothetical protein